MSSYISKAKNPKTEKIEDAQFLDNYYGSREYGVRFGDGNVFSISEIEKIKEVARELGIDENDYGEDEEDVVAEITRVEYSEPIESVKFAREIALGVTDIILNREAGWSGVLERYINEKLSKAIQEERAGIAREVEAMLVDDSEIPEEYRLQGFLETHQKTAVMGHNSAVRKVLSIIEGKNL